MGLGIGWRISRLLIVHLLLASVPSSRGAVSSAVNPALDALPVVHTLCSKLPPIAPYQLSESRVNPGFPAALGDQTPAPKIDHLISPAFIPKELAGNCEHAFKICRQGHSGEEDIFALPIRSPTAAETPSRRKPARAVSVSAQTMAAAPPATEESPVSYEELNDLNAEFDDAETELSMDLPLFAFELCCRRSAITISLAVNRRRGQTVTNARGAPLPEKLAFSSDAAPL